MAATAMLSTDPGTPVTGRLVPMLFVLQSGIITTAIALGGVYWLNKNAEDVSIMGWYANYVIPVGAILVGLVAGLGYGIASWWLGVRISRWLLLAVVLLQTGAYFAAEYVEYRDHIAQAVAAEPALAQPGVLPGFWETFDYKARSFQWESKNANDKTEPLGAWGYLFVGLAIVGFIGGGLIVPAVLYAKPYCSRCQRYKNSRVLATFAASVPLQKIKKMQPTELAAYEAAQQGATDAAQAVSDRIRLAAEAGDAEAFMQALPADRSPRGVNKLPSRVQVSLVHCRSCHTGELLQTIITGTGDKTQQAVLNTTPVDGRLVKPIVGSRV